VSAPLVALPTVEYIFILIIDTECVKITTVTLFGKYQLAIPKAICDELGL